MAVSHHNTRRTKTCDPPATRTKTYRLYKTYTTYGCGITALAFFHSPPPSQKLPALCPENVLPLAARPHSAMVVHQLHHTLPGVPSVCQMGHSVWAFWPNRCEFYRPKSVLKTAGALYVCACLFLFLFVFFFSVHTFADLFACSYNIKHEITPSTFPAVRVTAVCSKKTNKKHRQIAAKKTVPYLILLNFQ